MRSLRPPIILAAAAIGGLAGCSDYHREERPPWRAAAENSCLASGLVHETATIRPFHELDGPGICGAVHPFKVTALDDGTVALNATQTLDCPMIAALDRWVKEVVQPAAERRFGERVVRINSMGSYSCRGINNMSGANLSEHSFANAIDIGGFVLASGRDLNIMRGFNGHDEQESAFLHEAHAGACTVFTTVLGPGYNIFHYNHFHLDLAMHGSTSRGPRRYCKPVPLTNLPGPPVKDNLPDPPPLEEEMDIARTPLPAPSYTAGPAILATAIPAVPRPAGALALRPLLATGPAASVRVSARSAPIDPPLISFASPSGGEAAPSARGPRSALPGLAPVMRDGPVPVLAERQRPQATDPDGAPSPAPRPTLPAPPAEGSPAEWDLTSSIGR